MDAAVSYDFVRQADQEFQQVGRLTYHSIIATVLQHQEIDINFHGCVRVNHFQARRSMSSNSDRHRLVHEQLPRLSTFPQNLRHGTHYGRDSLTVTRINAATSDNDAPQPNAVSAPNRSYSAPKITLAGNVAIPMAQLNQP